MTMDVRPQPMADSSHSDGQGDFKPFPSSKYVSVRAWNTAGQLVLDSRIDLGSRLAINTWSSVTVNFLSGISHDSISSIQFYTSSGYTTLPRETRVIFNVDNLRPTAQ